MLIIFTAWLLVAITSAHKHHNHAALHERRLACPRRSQGLSDGTHQSKHLWPSPASQHAWQSTAYQRTSSTTISMSTQMSATSASYSSSTPGPTNDPWPGHVVTGYYGVGEAVKNNYPPSAVPWQYLTHLCFAFATTTPDLGLKFDDALLGSLSTEAHRHGVKPVLSIGGYGTGGAYFSRIVQNNTTIAHFVQIVKGVVDQHNLAGVDIDWEFVGDLANPDKLPDFQQNPQTDAAGYLALLKALRESLGPTIELSAAVPMGTFVATDPTNSNKLSPIDMSPYVPFLDRVYLMGYDLWYRSDIAGANAAVQFLNASEFSEDQGFISEGIEAWGEAFPREKLVYGVPFYGKGYNLLETSDPYEDGLYTPVSKKSRGDNGESLDSTSGFWRWRNLKSQGVLVRNEDHGGYEGGEGWQTGWDESTQTPYVFNIPSNNSHSSGSTVPGYGQIISYDDPNSLRLKRRYAKQEGLGGMMFWLADADTEDGELMSVLA